MSVLDYSDLMIFAGSYLQGQKGTESVSFVGALVASLGINIQFEETRLSITRIVATSLIGFFVGQKMKKTS